MAGEFKRRHPGPKCALFCQTRAWALHDLRRTAVTGMAELGVQPRVIEAVVNHVSGHKTGVAGVYIRATYAGEKREALERWAEHAAQIASMDDRSAKDLCLSAKKNVFARQIDRDIYPE